MQTREDVLAWLTDALVELLELDPATVTPEATLAELDIDSIDAVDVVVRFRELTGRRVEPEVFRNVRTIGDVVEALHGLIGA
jgi:acyl carrier protein